MAKAKKTTKTKKATKSFSLGVKGWKVPKPLVVLN